MVSVVEGVGRYRIPEERRERKDGLCPDCAGALLVEMGRVFRMREVVEVDVVEKMEEKEKAWNGNGNGGKKGGGWMSLFS
jgi:hypothetical protein